MIISQWSILLADVHIDSGYLVVVTKEGSHKMYGIDRAGGDSQSHNIIRMGYATTCFFHNIYCILPWGSSPQEKNNDGCTMQITEM